MAPVSYRRSDPIEFLQEIDFAERLLPHYLSLLPWALMLLTGIVLALVFWGRHPGPALCVFAGLALQLLMLLIRPVLTEWFFHHVMVEGWDPDRTDSTFQTLMVSLSIVDAGAYGLLIWAAFGWRGARPQPGAQPALQGRATALHRGSGPSIRPLSKASSLGWTYGPLLLGSLLTVPVLLLAAQGDEDLLPLFFGAACFSMLAMLLGIVMLMRLLYRLWAALQGGVARTTPGKAVGFLLIPLFNFYWVFQAYRGWAVDCNRTLDAYGLRAPRATEGVALALCIFTLLALIPYVGLVFSLVNLILGWIFFSSAIDCVNAMAAVTNEEAEPAPGGVL